MEPLFFSTLIWSNPDGVWQLGCASPPRARSRLIMGGAQRRRGGRAAAPPTQVPSDASTAGLILRRCSQERGLTHICTIQAKDERDEAKMERQRAEKAAQDAYTNGITSNSAEWRIEAQIDSYRDSERKAIEENDKELKEAIENAQEQIAKAQEKMEDKADKDKDSAKNAVRKAMRSASSDFTREVKGVKHMVRQLRREFDKKPSTPSYAAPPYVTPPYAATPYAASPYAAPPYAALSYGTPPWPYSPVYGGAVAGAGVYHQGRWQDKAIFLQRSDFLCVNACDKEIVKEVWRLYLNPSAKLIERTPPWGLFFLGGFQTKSPTEEDLPGKITPKIDQFWWMFLEGSKKRGGPLPPGNHPKR